MNRDEAILQMLRQCGQKQNNTQAREDAVTELVNAQNKFERGPLQPWWLVALYTADAFKTTVNQDTVALPTSFLREIDDSVTDINSLWYYDAEEALWTPVYKEDYSIAQRKYNGTDPGVPKLYCLIGTDIMLFPTPEEEWSLRLLAAFGQESLAGAYGGAGNVENTWLQYAHDMMIGEAGKQLCSGYFRDTGGTAHFTSMLTNALNRVATETQAKYEAGMLRAMGV